MSQDQLIGERLIIVIFISHSFDQTVKSLKLVKEAEKI